MRPKFYFMTKKEYDGNTSFAAGLNDVGRKLTNEPRRIRRKTAFGRETLKNMMHIRDDQVEAKQKTKQKNVSLSKSRVPDFCPTLRRKQR